MTAAGSDGDDQCPPIDAGYVGNLDALTRDLVDIEAIAAAALSEQPIDRATAKRIAAAPKGLTYDELTAHNQERREVEAWGEADITDILDPVALNQLDV